ncbi:MAG: dihydroorotase [Synechococcaceae cyanobacterium]|jgi:dihydroorotase
MAAPLTPPEPRPLLVRGVSLLPGPAQPSRLADVRIDAAAGRLLDLEASPRSGEPQLDGSGCWLGPPLVDPHSVLEEPRFGRAETLASLAAAAAAGGYGTVALLPWARDWRDRPERLDLHWPEPLQLLLWGSFSREGLEAELAPHGEQLEAGAVGLACGESLPPLALLERGLVLAEMGGAPVLVAPRDRDLAARGFVRERVEALRAGWPLDPVLSETLPLHSLLTLAESVGEASLRLMNVSTAEAVALLRSRARPAQASVCWWHLLADSGHLDPADEGWRLVPSLGGPADREALIAALADGVLSAVAIHHQPLDPEEQLLPLDQRRPGMAGHGPALGLLWQELVERRGWEGSLLWQRLCWGPASFLGLPAQTLQPGSRRWILFDPTAERLWCGPSQAANQPARAVPLRGAVVASGLSDPAAWMAPGIPPHGTGRSARRPGR